LLTMNPQAGCCVSQPCHVQPWATQESI
jgi:hypothetical protein